MSASGFVALRAARIAVLCSSRRASPSSAEPDPQFLVEHPAEFERLIEHRLLDDRAVRSPLAWRWHAALRRAVQHGKRGSAPILDRERARELGWIT
jgi:hypothetical protein